MKVYLVGGAVRDQLLGLPVLEKDWVVVGATADEMLRAGYQQVGKDFPVFLHPKTKEEYALARKERKVGRGYTGFDFDATPQVTLEEDLLRRDLTMNAIAKDEEGHLIDPYHGLADIEKKILRHVSAAFVEDPVRILRLARFAARFESLGFTVAPETMTLMQQMVDSGEVDALVAERVWKELERALQEKDPLAFFTVLKECGALAVLFPEIKEPNLLALQRSAALVGHNETTNAPVSDHHVVLEAFSPLENSPLSYVRFAAMMSASTLDDIKNVCRKYRVPSDCQDLALIVAAHAELFPKVLELGEQQLMMLLLSVDAFRREARFMSYLQACLALCPDCQPQRDFLLGLFHCAKAVEMLPEERDGLVGKQIGEFLNQKRLDAIKAYRYDLT